MKTQIPLVIACPVMKNNKNISMIARSASCFGAKLLIITGQNKVDDHIARDYKIAVEKHRSLLPLIDKYSAYGYRIIGLEQGLEAFKLNDYKFEGLPTFLVVGNECNGIRKEIRDKLDKVVEIPLLDLPYSLNVAVATSIFLFEFAKQLGQSDENAINKGSV